MRTTRPLPLLFVVFLVGCAADHTIKRAPELPSTTPWDLKALSEPPAFEWVDEKSPVKALMYAGEPYKGEATKVFAYYATPGTLAGDTSLDVNLPGVVLVHGGGGTAFREWAELWAKRGYAAIAMDLRGQRPMEGVNAHDPKNRTPLDDGGPMQSDDYIFFAIDQPVTEHWPYHAVANVIRGHSLLRSFPAVDADRTAVTGISWGGYLTCIVASLDNRFKAAVPVYGCGFLHENSAWLDHFKKLGPDKAARWVELYDPSRYLPACRVPIFFVNGTHDFAYPLDSYMKSYNLVKGAKNIRVTVNMPHGHPPGWEPKEIGMFVDSHVPPVARSFHEAFREKITKGLGTVVLVSSPGVVAANGKDARLAEVGLCRRLSAASLHYTTEAGPINKRNWSTMPLEWEEKPSPELPFISSIQLEIPPDATAWFLTVTDDRGATVSSGVIFAD